MAKKLMIMPSARTKYVKDANMELIFKTLLVLSVVMIGLNYYMYSFMHAFKLFLMIPLALLVTRETEILFYSHDKDITRQEAKDLIKKSYWKVTALLYVLLIPVGVPLWLVALGAVLATVLGKLLFGGFHHMVFHTSLVGFIFVTEGWTQLMSGVTFSTAFDNFILELLFDNEFFNNTLSIGSVFDPNNYTTALGMLENGTSYDLANVMVGITPGVVGSGLLILCMFGFLLYKKAVNWITPTVLLVSFFVVSSIYALALSNNMLYPIYHLFSGSLLYVSVFIVTDPITTPIETKGKIIFGVIAGALTAIIRHGLKYEEGVIFAVLFMMMLTPMLNTTLKKPKKKPVKKVVKKEAV